MTAKNQPSTDPAFPIHPADFLLHEVSARRASLHRVAIETRRLIDALIASPASEEQLMAAAAAIVSVVERLPLRPPGMSARLTSEASLTDGHGVAFLDYSPIIGLANPVALPVTLRFVGDHVEGLSTFTAAYEGPPGHVHGGWIAAAFDEVLGMVQTFSGAPGMTGRLSINYRSPTPLDTPLRWEGTMDRVDGRKIYTSGRVFNADTGTLLAEAEGLFISVDFGRFTSEMAPPGFAAHVPPGNPTNPNPSETAEPA